MLETCYRVFQGAITWPPDPACRIRQGWDQQIDRDEDRLQEEKAEDPSSGGHVDGVQQEGGHDDEEEQARQGRKLTAALGGRQRRDRTSRTGGPPAPPSTANKFNHTIGLRMIGGGCDVLDAVWATEGGPGRGSKPGAAVGGQLGSWRSTRRGQWCRCQQKCWTG